MQQVTKTNFGLLIAYLIPGFIALVGMSDQSETIRAWLVGHDAVTLGGFLYSTIAALVIGLVCITVRWIAIDTLQHKTGIRRPDWSFADLQEILDAYMLLEENRYRSQTLLCQMNNVAILLAMHCGQEQTRTL